jgi:hypothetical protein
MATTEGLIATISMDELRWQFSQRMAADLALIVGFEASVRERPPSTAESAVVRSSCHKLCGSAGLFGFTQVADAAARAQAMQASDPGGASSRTAIRALIEQLSRALGSSRSSAGAGEPENQGRDQPT